MNVSTVTLPLDVYMYVFIAACVVGRNLMFILLLDESRGTNEKDTHRG